MKNQIRGLVASLSILTMTACVGSVNVPSSDTGGASGEADAKESAKKTRLVRPLTLADLPAHPNDNFISTSDNSPSGSCVQSVATHYSRQRCEGKIPSTINIAPLNDSNTGIATYSGSVSVNYYKGRSDALDGAGKIDVTVNFSNNTLRYAGVIEKNAFNINGSFTDRGVITGSVNFGGSGDAPLIGLIGQNEAMGVFASGTPRGQYAGGFTLLRDE